MTTRIPGSPRNTAPVAATEDVTPVAAVSQGKWSFTKHARPLLISNRTGASADIRFGDNINPVIVLANGQTMEVTFGGRIGIKQINAFLSGTVGRFQIHGWVGEE